tara:strand:+ start:2567 stop:2767 length:201 start_codon:yes stop_codon:yes gene_type:complete
MSFTYSVNTDGTVSNIQFAKTEVAHENITCAQVVMDDLTDQNGLETFLDNERFEEFMDEQWDEYNS